MIESAEQPMKAMLLLAINAGLGNNDIGQLPLKALDLERGWLNYCQWRHGQTDCVLQEDPWAGVALGQDSTQAVSPPRRQGNGIV